MRFGFVTDVDIPRLRGEARGEVLTTILDLLEEGKVKTAARLMRRCKSLPAALEVFLGDYEAAGGDVVCLDALPARQPVSGQGAVDLVSLAEEVTDAD